MAQSMAFTDTTNSSSGGNNSGRDEWIDRVGTYHYYALILAEFNPNEALEILDNPAHVIAEAFVSMKCWKYVDPKEFNYGR